MAEAGKTDEELLSLLAKYDFRPGPNVKPGPWCVSWWPADGEPRVLEPKVEG